MSELVRNVKRIINDSEDFYVVEYTDKDAVQIPTMKDKHRFREQMNKSSDEEFSNQLKGNAEFYFNAAEILELARPKKDSAKIQELSPIGVLVSFCCELYLKWLIFREKGNKNECKGHELEKLYDKLDLEVKEKIKNSKRMSEFNFELLIAQHNEAFECIRYLHEHKMTTFNYRFLLQFATTLKEICYDEI